MRRFWWWMVPLALGACDGSSGGGGDDDDDDDAPGQGQPLQQACRNAADCTAEAGGELDFDQCVSDSERGLQEAQDAGCGQEYASLARCIATGGCDAQTGAITGCDNEFAAYLECAY